MYTSNLQPIKSFNRQSGYGNSIFGGSHGGSSFMQLLQGLKRPIYGRMSLSSSSVRSVTVQAGNGSGTIRSSKIIAGYSSTRTRR